MQTIQITPGKISALTTINAEEIHRLCEKYGYAAKQPSLTDVQIQEVQQFKDARSQEPLVVHQCDCGNLADHRDGSSWECPRCQRIRRNLIQWERQALERSVHRLNREGNRVADIARLLGVDDHKVYSVLHPAPRRQKTLDMPAAVA